MSSKLNSQQKIVITLITVRIEVSGLLRFTPAAKLFSTFTTVCLVVCLKIHIDCKLDSHTHYNHVTAAIN